LGGTRSALALSTDDLLHVLAEAILLAWWGLAAARIRLLIRRTLRD